MNRTFISRGVGLVALAGIAGLAAGQDSVSSLGTGLPGDALSPYTAGAPFQRADYVLDLVAFQSSWGNEFAIGPIAKSAPTSATFFNNLISAQSFSQTLLQNATPNAQQYAAWTQAGGGVHPSNNNTGLNTSVNAPATVTQFGVVAADFGGNGNTIFGAVAGFDPSNPTRLYVSRYMVASNGASTAGNSAQFGIGSVDANGNAYIRQDDFGTSGAPSGNNLWRVNMPARDPNKNNQISALLADRDQPATDWIVRNSTTTHGTPSSIPAQIAGGRGLVMGGNFSDQMVRGTANGSVAAPVVTADSTHIAGLTVSATRGTMSFSPAVIFAGSVGSGSMLGYNANGDADRIVAWGLNAAGNVAGNTELILPATIQDPCTGFDPTTAYGLGGTPLPIGAFTHYFSQTGFRGGNGQTALGRDPQGRALAAGVVSYPDPTSPDGQPFQSIYVARFAPGAPVEWTVAAHLDPSLLAGKPIEDGNGATIGNLVGLNILTGGTPFGPTISGVGFDGAGNIWFVAPVQISGEPFPKTALIRGVYDAQAFCYHLELVASRGQIVAGANSGRNYRINFIEIADSNSVSSGAFWSSNVSGATFNNISTAGLDQDDPRTLGGLVLSAEIIYDVDMDNDFEDPTSAGGNPASLDEAYAALLYVGAGSVQSVCEPDLTTGAIMGQPGYGVPNGVLNNDDFFYFLAQFAAGNVAVADLTTGAIPGMPGYGVPNGIITNDDFFYYLAIFAAGC
ncbi:MAG: GC-type dockerin domain-anchored protein [Phycisphaerales bacterium]